MSGNQILRIGLLVLLISSGASLLAQQRISEAARQPAPTLALPAPIYSRQTSFAIPFTIPKPTNALELPTEIRLFASADGGKSWQMADANKLTPGGEAQRGQFEFRAPGDGEYLFAIRTIDRQGQLRGGKQSPELRVVVDTQPPQIKLTAQRGAAGEVVVRYELADPILTADTLTLAYQLAGQTEWRSVAFDKPRGGQQPLAGMTTFWAQNAAAELLLRAEVRDRAENLAVAQVRLDTSPAAQGQSVAVAPVANTVANPPPNLPNIRELDPPPSFPTTNSNVAEVNPANRAVSNGSTRWSEVANPYVPANNNAPASSLNAAAFPLENTINSAPTNSAPTVNNGMRLAPADNAGPLLFGPQEKDGAAQGSAVVAPPLQPQLSPLAPRVEKQVLPNGTTGLSVSTNNSTSSPHAGELTPSNSAASALGTTPPANSVLAGFNTQQGGPRPRMVNSRVFEWEYDLESIGAAGIARVELWVTRDNGRTWASMGVDPDNRSPIRTGVRDEGLYGYRITVQSAGGALPRAPQAGDLPEMWIGVDLSKPTVRMLNAELGTGPQLGEIAITWEAGDALLATRPVTLQYAAQPGGPWTVIAAGLENNGRYAWRYDAQTPERIYLRLEARDEAGNIGVSESSEPVSLERTIPTGKLRAVRPVTDPAPQSSVLPQQPPTALPPPQNFISRGGIGPGLEAKTASANQYRSWVTSASVLPTAQPQMPVQGLPPQIPQPPTAPPVQQSSQQSSALPINSISRVWQTPAPGVTSAQPQVVDNPYLAQPNAERVQR